MTFLLVLLAAVLPAHRQDAAGLRDPAGMVTELSSPDAARARAAADELRALGADAHALVWRGFAESTANDRRARSRWVLEDGSAHSLREAAAALIDPDAGVRANLARYLGQVAAGAEDERALRLEALLRAGEIETSPAVRAALADALLSVGGAGAARALATLLERWPEPERGVLARRLAELHGASATVFELVRAGFAPDPGHVETPPDVLAALLPAYARELADREEGETARDRAPLALGLRHPAPEVRAAALDALEQAVGRLRLLDRPRRADALLAALAREGPDPRAGQYRRALQALQEGLDPELALGAARELERISGAGLDRAERLWRYRAVYLAAAAQLCAGEGAACEAELDRARPLLEALLAERADLAARGGAAEELELLHHRALLEVLAALQRIAIGRSAADGEVLELLRTAHELELRAELAAVQAEREELPYLDVLFEVPMSPYRLIFARKPHAAWPVERCLDAQEKLGRAFASVAGREMIGFEPIADALPGRSDPLEDPPRKKLLLEILSARASEAWREYSHALDEVLDNVQRGLAVSAEAEQRLMQLERSYFLRKQAADESDLAKSYDDVRGPSFAGLSFAQALSEEGRTRECREVARRMLDALAERGLEQRSSLGLQLAAEVQITIGSSWTADDEPVKAEEELEKAVERLDSLEQFYVERGATGLREAVRGTRAGALVSLAVNANVKLGDASKAVSYFEAAYELRKDDFMRVLLACYRARSGRAAEAREILSEVPHAPRYYYNLACTYALLGERERALELLERELAENHPSPGSLAQQKEWARTDPDLEPLREDPRFAHLVGTEDGGAGTEGENGR